VFIHVPAITGGAPFGVAGVITLTTPTAIPANILPLSNKTCVVSTVSNAVNVIGQCLLTAAGAMTVSAGVIGTNFSAAGGANSFEGFTLAYDRVVA